MRRVVSPRMEGAATLLSETHAEDTRGHTVGLGIWLLLLVGLG